MKSVKLSADKMAENAKASSGSGGGGPSSNLRSRNKGKEDSRNGSCATEGSSARVRQLAVQVEAGGSPRPPIQKPPPQQPCGSTSTGDVAGQGQSSEQQPITFIQVVRRMIRNKMLDCSKRMEKSDDHVLDMKESFDSVLEVVEEDDWESEGSTSVEEDDEDEEEEVEVEGVGEQVNK